MIKYSNSNVFNTNAEVIVNTINCVGFMGRGLALEYALRYPDLLKDYEEKCKNKEIEIGKVYYFKSGKQLIANIPTKKDFKKPSKMEWIISALENFRETYNEHNIKTIAFPILGGGLGGLDKEKVLKIMEEYLDIDDLEVIICLDKNGIEGKEKEMLEMFKSCKISTLESYMKLSSKQKEILENAQKSIQRFSALNSLPGIGATTYKKLHNVFYNNIIDMNTSEEQFSLF